MGLHKKEIALTEIAVVTVFQQFLPDPGAALLLDGQHLVKQLRVIQHPLAKQQRNRVHLKARDGFLHIFDDFRPRDHDAHPQTGHGAQLGKRPKHDHIVIFPEQRQKAVGIEVKISLVDDDHSLHLPRPLNDGAHLGLRVYTADGVIGVQKRHQIGVLVDGLHDLLAADFQILIVGNTNMFQTQHGACHPVHFKRRSHCNDGLAFFYKGFQNITDRHDRTVGEAQILRLYPQIIRVFLLEHIRLRVGGQILRRDLRQYAVHKCLWQSLRVFIHIQPQIGPSALLRINPDTVSDIFIYIIHRYPCFLISFAQPVPAA